MNRYGAYYYESPPLPRGVKYLLISTIAVFFLQMLVDGFTPGIVATFFGLSSFGIKHFFLWQFVTYMFLHAAGLTHILFNMIGLFFFGRDIENNLGTARFLKIYFGAGIIGGIGWLLLSRSGGYCIGASGAVYGLLGTFAALFPNRRITLLLFFILPITLTARAMAIWFGLISLFFTLEGGGNIAHAAHLAGGVFGYLYGVHLKRNYGIYFGMKKWPSGKGVFKRIRDLFYHYYTRARLDVLGPDADYIPSEQEVNDLLDKIAEQGIENLSSHERRILDLASRHRSRRDSWR